MSANVQPNETYVTGVVARKNDRVITRDGISFVVSAVRTVLNEYDEKERAAFGLNEDGSEHGPYWAHEYAIQPN